MNGFWRGGIFYQSARQAEGPVAEERRELRTLLFGSEVFRTNEPLFHALGGPLGGRGVQHNGSREIHAVAA